MSVSIIGEALQKSSVTEKQGKEPEVSATEELMRVSVAFG